ncbi:hypothetical protein BGW42_007679 [Actinomortierella wolfii]|nr:hypothetical protein BGW42_007679 [Actinomortierella wolfii]
MESTVDGEVQRTRATQYRGLTKSTIDSVQDDRVIVVLDTINDNIDNKKVNWDTVKSLLEHRASLQPKDERFVGISLDVLKGFLKTRLAAFRPRFELYVKKTGDPEPLPREDQILYEIDRQLEPARYPDDYGKGRGSSVYYVGNRKNHEATERAWQHITGKRGREHEDATESEVEQVDDLTESAVSESDSGVSGPAARSAVSNRQSTFARQTTDGIKRVRAASHNLRVQGASLRQGLDETKRGLDETKRAVEDLRRDVSDYRREVIDIKRDFSNVVSQLKETLRDEIQRSRQDINSIVPNIHYLLRAFSQQQQSIPMYPLVPPRQ